MKYPQLRGTTTARLRTAFWLTGIGWVILFVSSLLWDIRLEDANMLELARTEARSRCQQDLIYRAWATTHGGVYVVNTTPGFDPKAATNNLSPEVATTTGLQMSLMEPDTLMRQVHDLSKMSADCQSHITSLKPSRRENEADAWETKALLAFVAGETEVDTVEIIKGRPFLRLMQPMRTEAACMKCHEESTHRLGEIRGGISASVPLASYEAVSRAHIVPTAIWHGTIGALGLFGLWFGYRRLSHSARLQNAAHATQLASEQRFRFLFDHASNIAAQGYGPDGVVRFWNKASEQLYGYTAAEAIGRNLLDLIIPPEMRAGVRDAIRQMVETGQVIPSGELSLMRKDGSRVSVYSSHTIVDTGNQSWELYCLDVDLTKRKEAEAALQKNEARLQKVLEVEREIANADLAYPALIKLLLDRVSHLNGADGACLELSEGDEMVYESAIGIAAPHVGLRLKIAGSLSGLCMTKGEVLRSDDTEKDPRVDQAACRRIGLRSMILLPLHYNAKSYGVLKLMAVRAHAFTDDNETISRLIAEFLCAFISRKRTEVALQKSEEQFRSIVEDADIAAFVALEMKFTYLNPAAMRLLGVTQPDQILGQPVLSRIHPDYHASILKRSAKVMQGLRGSAPSQAEIYLRMDGTQVVVEATASPICYHDQPAAVVFLQDISERTRAETALRKSEAQLRTLVENIPQKIFLKDLNSRYTFINESFARDLGVRPDEAVGKSDHDFFPRELANSYQADDQRIITSGQPEEFEEQYRGQNGERWVHTVKAPVRDKQGDTIGVCGIFRDITAQRQLEQQFRQSQKMESFGQLAGGVAHDFNNILAVIIMQAQLAGASETNPAEMREGLDEIKAAAERAANLTRQLLLFSRREVMQSKDLDLNDVVTSLTKMLHRIIGEDVSLQLHLHPKPLIAHADPGMLDQILMNLAVNARDAMPGGGKLDISTSEKMFDETETNQQPDLAPGRYACLAVRDTGAGIPPEVIPRIFEPFFTTKEPGKGTGLGLATVFGIVKQHKGMIKVQSETGKGTEFQIFLPARDVAPADIIRAGQSKPFRGTETILLTEDDAALRKVTCVTLERHGYHVLAAAAGVEALELWTVHQNKIALLITDMVMPGGMSGLQLARRLKAEQPNLRILYTSGYSAEVAGRNLDLHAGESFVQKPCPLTQLLETVRRCLDD